MTARRCTLEFVRTEVPTPRFEDGVAVAYTMRPEWYWRFLASNGPETGKASETYKNRIDCIRSAELTTGCYSVRECEARGFDYCRRAEVDEDGRGYETQVRVRSVRTEAKATPAFNWNGDSTSLINDVVVTGIAKPVK